jgi:NAD(P)-dependent dehydrogenase (short-subunit alcohol dehydrogenase family)
MIRSAAREKERFVRLKDRVAIITGWARGIGRAIALGFAREGARVATADVRITQAQDAAEANEASGGQALALEVDVSRLADLDRMVAGTVEWFAGIDILCNNAGVPGASATCSPTPRRTGIVCWPST